jgi:phage terminase Nu1 subunit (DNA packaging protein)
MSAQHDNSLTVAAWAATIGVSRQSAYEAIRRCGIPVVDGRVDGLAATALYKARTRIPARTKAASAALHRAQEVAGVNPSEDLHHWRTRNARADALVAEMELAERQTKFIEVEPLIALLQRHLIVFKTLLLALPTRLAQELPGTHAERVVAYNITTRLMHEALENLSGGPLEELEAQAAALRAAEAKK